MFAEQILRYLLEGSKYTGFCRINDHIDTLLGNPEDENKLEMLNQHYRLTSINEAEFLDFLFERA